MVQTADNPDTREIAQWLLAHVASSPGPASLSEPTVFRVCEKLRLPLSTLAGAAGFRSLLARALTLAKRESPDIGAWQVKEDGSLGSLNGESEQAGTVLISHLIGLLITFIGKTLTLRLLHDAWPGLPGSDANSREKQ